MGHRGHFRAEAPFSHGRMVESRREVTRMLTQDRIGLDEVITEDVEYCEGLTATSTLLAICTGRVGPRSSERKGSA